jgi:hypothetical protein
MFYTSGAMHPLIENVWASQFSNSLLQQIIIIVRGEYKLIK